MRVLYHSIRSDYLNFSFSDKVIKKCDELGLIVILDFLHFGLPDWMHEETPETPYFQNKKFPEYFQPFVETIAKRYPNIKYFTPVNEPFVTANLSAKLGFWNESLTSDETFSRAVVNIARAAVLAKEAIETVWEDEERPDEPIFIQNESFEEAIALPDSNREMEADSFNMYRFSALDLILGHRDNKIQQYLNLNGIADDEYEWFMSHGNKKNMVIGIDYYPWCIHEYYKENSVDHNITMPYQLFKLVSVYWERYHLPLLHTEVNGLPEYAVPICQMTFDSIYKLRMEGIPVLGMGWYGDEVQMDWQTTLRTFGSEYPVGLYYHGQLQQVGRLFQELAKTGFPKI